MKGLMDKQGRQIRKLRVSLLDACNLRCLYCMPENPEFGDKDGFASPEELFEIARNLVQFGVEEIRITGGEPTLRRDLAQIASLFASLPVRLSLTTNAVLLKRFLKPLKEAGIEGFNISMDSLDRETFGKMSRRDLFDQVYHNVLLAKEIGFKVKINCVVMRGINDHEVLDFVEWSAHYQIPVRFLEVMNIGVMKPQFEKRFIPEDQLREKIESRYTLTKIKVPKDSTASVYSSANGAEVGFISSESKPFCSGCSRLRLNARGQVLPCLFSEHGISLKGRTIEEYPELLAHLINLKPIMRQSYQPVPMYQIGG